MNRFNKTGAAISSIVGSISEGSVFPDYLEVTTVAVVPRGLGKTSTPTSFKCYYFFHILVLQEYWVLTERRIPLKPVLGGVRIVALCISSHEQTQ